MRASTLVIIVAVSFAACKKEEGAGEHKPASGGASGSAATSTDVDACKLVTQADATALFGVPAEPYEANVGPTPTSTSKCDWQHDFPDNSSWLLQFSIYDSTSVFGAYSPEPFQEAFAIGEKGVAGAQRDHRVAVMWVQKGKTVTIDLSSTGPKGEPKAAPKLEQVKQLAKKVEAAL